MHKEDKGNIKYNRVLLERLNQVVPQIVDAFDPEEIIMYGSYARGDNDIYSDIDVIVIVREMDLRFQDRSIKVLQIINGETDESDIAINPIVYTSKEFKEMLENQESFLISALKESVLVWKKNANTSVESQLESGAMESDFKKFV